MSVPALTTTFTPAASCLASSNVWEIHFTTAGAGAFDTYLYYLQGPPRTSDCLPENYDPVTTAYYSPGICPSGYTAACSYANTLGSLTETTLTCCPRYEFSMESKMLDSGKLIVNLQRPFLHLRTNIDNQRRCH